MASKEAIGVRVIAFVVAALAAVLGTGAPAAHAAGSAFCEKRYTGDLNQACAATERYWDEAVAIGDGFVESTVCEPSPSGAGTIGIQYTNHERAADQVVRVTEPESLIYLPEGAGLGRRLAALEYSVPFLGQPRPTLFGQEFGGPTPDRSGELPRYRLRVWLFSANPGGLFADANPVEACNGRELVAPDAVADDCHEVEAHFSVPVERVRTEGAIPPNITLSGETKGGGGTAQVNVGAFSCIVAVDGTAAPTLFTLLYTRILAPDWAGREPPLDRYFLRWVADNRAWAKAFRRDTGVGPDIFAYSPDGLMLEFNPIPGTMTGDYRFTSPDFVLRATIGDAVRGVIDAVSVRMLHDGPQGLARFHTRVTGAGVGPAVVDVAPRPGTLLARLIGCDPSPDPALCEDVRADEGLAIAWNRSAVTMTAERDWWNPRHDVGTEDPEGTLGPPSGGGVIG